MVESALISPVIIDVVVAPLLHTYVVGLTELVTVSVSLTPAHFHGVPLITGTGKGITVTAFITVVLSHNP